MGSADLAAISRSILHVCRTSQKSTLRYIRQVKCNIAPEGEDYAFELVDLGAVNWVGPIDSDEVDELDEEAKTTRSSRLNDAISNLYDLLIDKNLAAIEIMEIMHSKDFSTATIRRAKQELGIQSNKQSNQKWVWHLQDAE